MRFRFVLWRCDKHLSEIQCRGNKRLLAHFIIPALTFPVSYFIAGVCCSGWLLPSCFHSLLITGVPRYALANAVLPPRAIEAHGEAVRVFITALNEPAKLAMTEWSKVRIRQACFACSFCAPCVHSTRVPEHKTTQAGDCVGCPACRSCQSEERH